eukprot:111758-Chlamydomonas_euryale.AAC.5
MLAWQVRHTCARQGPARSLIGSPTPLPNLAGRDAPACIARPSGMRAQGACAVATSVTPCLRLPAQQPQPAVGPWPCTCATPPPPRLHAPPTAPSLAPATAFEALPRRGTPPRAHLAVVLHPLRHLGGAGGAGHAEAAGAARGAGRRRQQRRLLRQVAHDRVGRLMRVPLGV